MTVEHYIGGAFEPGLDKDAIPILNPYDNTEITRLLPATPPQVTAAIEAAHAAFRAFSVRLESGRIPKEFSMRESDSIDSLWGAQCRSRIRWTCVNE
jgi:hypothetical protein